MRNQHNHYPKKYKKKIKKNSQRKNMLILTVAITTCFIVAIIIFLIYMNGSVSSKDLSVLDGIYVYDESIKYEFDGSGKGTMNIDEQYKFEYTYKIKKEQLILNFIDDAVHDATYTYSLKGDILTLVGGEGTAGGEYTLSKESK